MKIAVSSQRPIPWRADSIGPWLNTLGFLSWLGTVVSSAIVSLFSGDSHRGPGGEPWNISAPRLLLGIVCAEHVYLGLQYAVRYVLRQVDSPGLQKERAHRFAMRRRLLEESLGSEVVERPVPPTVRSGERITREALENEARRMSVSGAVGTPEYAYVPPLSLSPSPLSPPNIGRSGRLDFVFHSIVTD